MKDQFESSIERQEGHKPGWNYKIVRFFLNQPQLTVMMFVLLLVIGVGSFLSLRVEGFPAVKLPIVFVSTPVPGAGPETVADIVSQPIENAVRDLDGVKEVSSGSEANFSFVVITYDDSVDVNLAATDVKSKVDSLKLPEGVTPNVGVPDIGGAQFLVAISGGTDLLSLRDQADQIKQDLLSIEGVKAFENVSGIDQEIYIEVEPQYPAQLILDQVKAANLGFPLGQTNVDGKLVPVVAKSAVASLEELRQLVVSLPDGRQVALSDIARVYQGVDFANRVHRAGFLDATENKFKIQPALIYEIKLESDADLLKVNQEVKRYIEDEDAQTVGVDYQIVLNQADEAERQVDEIIEGAVGGKWNFDSPLSYAGLVFGGAWLLLIAMLLFLDWRTAIISVLSLPLSFLFTFIYLAVTGTQLNTLVLFSLVLVLGLVVDPAIVVLESIRRYVDLGYKGKEAVLRSIDVIGLGLFVAVLTSVIVFVPFSVVSGTFGQIISYIPVTVFPALVASYFIPLIFLTWLGAKFIKPEQTEALHDEDDVHTLWPIARWFIKANRYILSHTWLSVLVVILGLVVPIVISVVLFATNQVRQVQFAQPDDSEFVQVSIPRPANQSYRDLQIMSTEVESTLKDYAKDIKTFIYASVDGNTSADQLNLFIELVPLDDRDQKSGEISERMQIDLRKIYGQKVQVGMVNAGPPGEEFPVSVKIFENDLAKQKFASEKIAEQLRSYEEIDLVKTDFDSQTAELDIKVDSVKANQFGLTGPSVYGQIAGLLGESKLFTLEGSEVIARTSEDTKPSTQQALSSSLVYGGGAPVKLSEIAQIKQTVVPTSIRSLNGERFASVSATVKDSRDAINMQRQITDWVKANSAELGVSERAFEDRAGVNEFEKSFQELFVAIFLSILVTYVAFVIFFRSFLQPFIILFAIPLILIGVFPALALFAGGQFGFLETIGILMVIGIAENVGIFLIDYANRKVRLGMNKREAVAIASGIRLRPIVLTKLTALAGLLPLAVFSPFWRGLALVVIFGILSSGVLSLFTTPVLYSWLTRKKTPVQPDQLSGLEDFLGNQGSINYSPENNEFGTKLEANTGTVEFLQDLMAGTDVDGEFPLPGRVIPAEDPLEFPPNLQV
ncbi:MAG: efflux RND transporter permease subunit [Candidatus Doudnabacteria bacterium]